MPRMARGDPHGPNTFDDYVNVYEHRLEALAGFIVDNGLTYTVTETVVLWEGTIVCQTGIELDVHRAQQVTWNREGRMVVQTVDYAYNAIRRVGEKCIPLLRYDNSHEHPRHPTKHHRHRFNEEGESLRVEHVGEDGWPHLTDVLEELRDHFQ